jgi:uncharacterized damage-inducible protein DinB
MDAYLASACDEDMEAEVTYRTARGETFMNRRGHLLTQAINHTTQHRSEVAVALTQLGHSPGDLDFVLYLRQ